MGCTASRDTQNQNRTPDEPEEEFLKLENLRKLPTVTSSKTAQRDPIKKQLVQDLCQNLILKPIFQKWHPEYIDDLVDRMKIMIVKENTTLLTRGKCRPVQ